MSSSFVYHHAKQEVQSADMQVVDLTLGFYFYRMQDPTTSKQAFYNPYGQSSQLACWLAPDKYTKAQPSGDIARALGIQSGFLEGVDPKKDLAIIIRPGETILAHTQEFLGGSGVGILTGHKDMALNFISVSAGGRLERPGYIDRWPLQVTNQCPYTVPLICGRKIASVCFVGGREALNPNWDSIVKAWKPQNILPPMHVYHNPYSAPAPTLAPAPAIPVSALGETEEVPGIQKVFQQEVKAAQDGHKKRTTRKTTLKLPEPERDANGKPIIPQALRPQRTATKKTVDVNYVDPNAPTYDPSKI